MLRVGCVSRQRGCDARFCERAACVRAAVLHVSMPQSIFFDAPLTLVCQGARSIKDMPSFAGPRMRFKKQSVAVRIGLGEVGGNQRHRTREISYGPEKYGLSRNPECSLLEIGIVSLHMKEWHDDERMRLENKHAFCQRKGNLKLEKGGSKQKQLWEALVF